MFNHDVCSLGEKMDQRAQMTKDEMVGMIFMDACVAFRNADLEGDTDKRDLFLNVTNALESAYPDAVSKAMPR